MRLILVRHGDPDYAHDCLTDLGHRQAAACARRLVPEGISRIYSSSNGRAMQTAGYTAELLGLAVTPLDFMREINWGSDTGDELVREGHPWTLGDRMIAADDYAFAGDSWRSHPYFAANRTNAYVDMIGEKLDELLAGYGLRREGTRYLCDAPCGETIALFAHGGSGACLLSHLLNLPFPYVCSVLSYGLTSVTILDFALQPDGYVIPKLALFGDLQHARDLMSEPAPCGR